MVDNIYEFYSKEEVYEVYSRLILDEEAYTKITKTKMVDEIIEYYNALGSDEFHSLISNEERKMLTDALKGAVKITSVESQEVIFKLRNKFLLFLDNDSWSIPEPIKNSIENLIKIPAPDWFERIDFMNQLVVGILKVHAILVDEELAVMVQSYLKLNNFDVEMDEIFEYFEDSIYLRFELDYIEHPQIEETLICSNIYQEELDEIIPNIKKFETPNKYCNPQTYLNFSKYGYENNNEMKAFNEMLNEYFSDDQVRIYRQLFMKSIATLDTSEGMEELMKATESDEKTLSIDLSIIKHAYDSMPTPSLGGRSLEEYYGGEKAKIPTKRESAPARLSDKECDLFYDVYFALLEYTNDKYQVEPELFEIYQQLHMPQDKMINIRNYVYEHRNVIDEFVADNKYNFDSEKLKLVEDFKYAINDTVFIAKYHKEYAIVLHGDDAYAVKGLRGSIQEILPDVPIPVRMTIMPFKGKIVFDGLIESGPIKVGGNMKKMISDQVKHAEIKMTLTKGMN